MISESTLADWPKKKIVQLAARAARRLLPIIAKATDEYGPEALEWMAACHKGMLVLDGFATGMSISRFTLDLVAEIARGTANSAANVVRMIGPSKAAEDCELAFAAVAFTADAARATPIPKVISCAMTALRNVEASGYVPTNLIERDVIEFTESLWPDGTPAWWSEGWSKCDSFQPFPQLFAFER